MLVNLLTTLFKKYIYTPHVHDPVFDRTVDVGLLKSTIVYICKDPECRAVLTPKEF